MRCAVVTVLVALCEGSAEVAFGCLSDRVPGNAEDIESERLSAAGSMSGMAMAGVEPEARAWLSQGRYRPIS